MAGGNNSPKIEQKIEQALALKDQLEAALGDIAGQIALEQPDRVMFKYNSVRFRAIKSLGLVEKVLAMVSDTHPDGQRLFDEETKDLDHGLPVS